MHLIVFCFEILQNTNQVKVYKIFQYFRQIAAYKFSLGNIENRNLSKCNVTCTPCSKHIFDLNIPLKFV